MTKNPITFTVNSCVPGYRGQLELKSNEGKDDKPFIYLRVIVDEFCLKLGREVLSDDDYVLEVQLSTTSSLTPSVSSSNEALSQSPGSSGTGASMRMTELQILEPDAEIAQLALPSNCTIYILDAQSTIAGERYSGKRIFSLNILQPAFFKSIPPMYYLILGIFLVFLGIIFIMVAALKNGPENFITDEVVVVSVMVNKTQISAFNWTRKKYAYSTVHPEFMKVDNRNISLSLYLSDHRHHENIISDFVTECVMPFFFQNESDDVWLFKNDIIVRMHYDFSFLWPETYNDLMKALVVELEAKKLKIFSYEFETRSHFSEVEWINQFYPAVNPVNFSLSKLTYGVITMTNYSSLIAFPYNSTLYASKSDLMTVFLNGKSVSLYGSVAGCYGLDVSISRYHYSLWKTSNYSSEVESGCYPEGARITISVQEFQSVSVCIPDFVVSADTESSSSENFTIIGTGSVISCKSSIETEEYKFENTETFEQKSLTSNQTSLSMSQCKTSLGFGGVACQPNLNRTNHFVAGGLYYNVANQLNLRSSSPSFENFELAVNSSCNRNESKQVNIEDEMVCVKSMFAFLMLTDRGYGLTKSTWNVTFTDTEHEQFEQAISSQSYLMLTSAQFEDNGGEPPLKRSTYAHKAVMVSLGILFLIFGVLAAAIFSHLRQRKHRSVFAYSEFE
ncbi:uncharacterized protein LOC134839137 isoform X2 [Symsagittifera roscoffensis]|uniref:uncharacterized protein LOC134839137 isoform X2 n=1 Tax=Symsagittifera roscoffensis TaxID=84072 RepID=UPI00307BCB57